MQGQDSFTDAEAARHLSGCDPVVVFTGAGASTGSGIPDFRSKGGIWETYRTVTIQEFEASHEGRCEYWRYKRETYAAFSGARPNDAHRAIARFHAAGRVAALVTQNIDGLHQQAFVELGLAVPEVLELHGSNRHLVCISCERTHDWSVALEQFDTGIEVPLCPDCEGFLKPATVSFGQSLPQDVLDRSMRASSACGAFVAIGSSLQVTPAAHLPLMAVQSGIPLFVVNRDPTPFDEMAAWVSRDDAVLAVPRLLAVQ